MNGIYCPNCGKEPGVGRYCANCGFELSNNLAGSESKFKSTILWPLKIINNLNLEKRGWFRLFRVLHILLFIGAVLAGIIFGSFQVGQSNCDYNGWTLNCSTNWFRVFGLGILTAIISLVISKAIMVTLVYIFGGKQNK